MARFIDELTHASLRAIASIGHQIRGCFRWVGSHSSRSWRLHICGLARSRRRRPSGLRPRLHERQNQRRRLGERMQIAEQVRTEWVIGIRGVVRSRGDKSNPKLATGEIEVGVLEVTVFNKSETPIFPIEDDIETRERCGSQPLFGPSTTQISEHFRIRHEINQVTRGYFTANGFLELETPFMVKYTPGGARISWCLRASKRAHSTRSQKARSSISSCLWSRVSPLFSDRAMFSRTKTAASIATRNHRDRRRNGFL